MEQSITVDIEAPAARVWAILRDAERWPEWTASVRRVTLHEGVLRMGATATIDQPRIPTVMWTVTGLTEGRDFTWESRGPGALRCTRSHDPFGSSAVASVMTSN